MNVNNISLHNILRHSVKINNINKLNSCCKDWQEL